MISLKMSFIAALYSFAFINSVDGRSNGIYANILEPESADSSSRHKDSDYYRAEKCIDGDRDYDRVCQTREENDTNPWIQLDFGSKVEIHAVRLSNVNRNGDSSKLQCQDDDCTDGFEIRVGNSKCDGVSDDCDRNRVCYASGKRRTAGESTITIEIEDCKIGRYLQLRLPGSGRVLKLREITVSGDYTCDRYGGISNDEGDVCCKESCGTCGGTGCSGNGDANDCCTGLIREEGNYCMDSSDDAPCQLARKFDEYEKHEKRECKGDGHDKVFDNTVYESRCKDRCTGNPNCSGYEWIKITHLQTYLDLIPIWNDHYDCYHWIRQSGKSPLERGKSVSTVKESKNRVVYKSAKFVREHTCYIKKVEEDFWSFDDDRRRRLQQMEESEILETSFDA